MKNLKYLQRFFILLFVGFALCAVQACGDDEENEPIQEPNEEEVVKPDEGQEEDEPNQKPDEEEEPSSKPTIGTINGHEYVDLGLSVKWATCNVGASKPEDYGGYYAWGETEEKNDYSWNTYKWCNGSSYTMTKYCISYDYGTVDGKTVIESSDDVAHVKWGGNWRMPIKEEIRELFEDCTWTWKTQSGIEGMKVTGPNGNSIFLPAAGGRVDTGFNNRGPRGYYWSATLGEYGSSGACIIDVYNGLYDWNRWSTRNYGFSVRPVTE